MVRSLVALVFRRVLAWLLQSNEHAKDLEISAAGASAARWSASVPLERRLVLAAASHHLARETWRAFLVTPQTVLRWPRALVRRKWSRGDRRRLGRPSLDQATRALILKLARENPRWGYQRIAQKIRATIPRGQAAGSSRTR
jgi:putative transposase